MHKVSGVSWCFHVKGQVPLINAPTNERLSEHQLSRCSESSLYFALQDTFFYLPVDSQPLTW